LKEHSIEFNKHKEECFVWVEKHSKNKQIPDKFIIQILIYGNNFSL